MDRSVGTNEMAPENLEDHVKLNELNQDLEAARQDQETKLTEWEEELSLELEEYVTKTKNRNHSCCFGFLFYQTKFHIYLFTNKKTNY